jgi:dolichol-phosphate mannosyltransferase
VKPLIVLPTYNERANLEQLVAAVYAQGPFSILIVDDNSPDGTGQLAEDLKLRYPGRLDVLHRAGKLGLGTAYLAGFRWALERDYDYIFEMDSDFSHDPARLPTFLREIESCDVVLGSRYVAGGSTPDWSLLRRIISRGGSIYARLVLGIPIRDLTGGFKCFRRDVLANLDLDSVRSNGYAFQIELNYRCFKRGFRLHEVPITFVDRRVGQSKMSGRIVVEATWLVWRMRFDRSIDRNSSDSEPNSNDEGIVPT